MFDNVVAGVLAGVLDDQTDRDVIALAQELVSPQGNLTLLHLHLLVMGGHKYRPIDHPLERSTPQQLSDEGTTPLLVLPAAETS